MIIAEETDITSNSMEKLPLVSILIPLYNSGGFVAETIECCLAQTYPNIEIVVVDDHSTDNSVEVVQRFLSNKVRLYTNPKKGGNSARNYAFEMSHGDYVLFHDADDFTAGSLRLLSRVLGLRWIGLLIGLLSLGRVCRRSLPVCRLAHLLCRLRLHRLLYWLLGGLLYRLRRLRCRIQRESALLTESALGYFGMAVRTDHLLLLSKADIPLRFDGRVRAALGDV